MKSQASPQDNTIQLPKGYLSYSAAAMWRSDPERYKKIYFDGLVELHRSDSKAMAYGSLVADALEKGEEDSVSDTVTHAALSLLPKYDLRDKELLTNVETSQGTFTMLAKPDSMSSKTKAFLEYKTGKVAWTLAKAQKSMQLKWYAAAIWNKYQVVPPNIMLVWIETQHDLDGKVSPTGKLEHFTVNISMKDIAETLKYARDVALEIQAAWAVHKQKDYSY